MKKMSKKLIGISVVVLILALLLALAPACGDGDEEPTPTPGITPVVTPTPGFTPTPTPEVETLKIGVITSLSGFAATWGTQAVVGAEWVRDRVNEQGGIKVGDDTYIIKFIKCDDKFSGSEAATCATRLIHDEGCSFLILGIGDAVSGGVIPIAEENKVIWLSTGASALLIPPELGHTRSYTFNTWWYPGQGPNEVYRGVAQEHPEIKTVGLLSSPGEEVTRPYYYAAVEAVGMEIIAESEYGTGTSDFYPALSSLVAKNPDAIDIEGASGAQPLMVKQARELGYTGHIFSCAGCPPDPMIQGAGAGYAEGYGSNYGEFSSPLYPPETNELFYEFYERYPNGILDNTVYWAYGVMSALIAGIEAAQSVDPTAVRDAMGAPGFTFSYLGMPATFEGEQTLGVRRQVSQWSGYSEIREGKLVMLGLWPPEPIP